MGTIGNDLRHIDALKKRVGELDKTLEGMKTELQKAAEVWSEEHVARVKDAITNIGKHHKDLQEAIDEITKRVEGDAAGTSRLI
jgi:gas vesicle protein